MCRSIKVLREITPAATPEDVSAAALQYVRKVSGFRAPSKANKEAFERAVREITGSTELLLASIATNMKPHSRPHIGHSPTTRVDSPNTA